MHTNGMQGRIGWLVTGLVTVLSCGRGSEQPLSVLVTNGQENGFSVTSTLISGARDAILVDAQFTLSDGARVADWIQQSGKRLTTVFITHGHPDHYFGLAPVLAKFPDAEVIATASVIEEMKAYAPQTVAQWKPLYGENLTDQPMFPKAFTSDHLTLEGHRIDLIALPPGESEHATALWIPSIRTVVAGDAVFNRVHVWLAGVNAERRASWLRNLDSLKALGPTTVVGGHRAPGAVDAPAVLDSTAQYIRDFSQTVAASRRPEEVISRMTAAHGNRTLPVILELAAKSAFPAAAPR
jgi:glyoxylase-like metal-dependent hydrolase (beta-lactamase superfamily II)